MQTILTWLMPVVLGAVGRMLGLYFSGTCRAGPGFVCDHWALICSVVGFILGAFGIGVRKQTQQLQARARSMVRAEGVEDAPAPSPGAPPDHALSSMPTSTPRPTEGATTHTGNPWGEGPPPPGWDPSGRR